MIGTVTDTLTSENAVKPVLLDLFCGGGGAGAGYARAGFVVVGVDLHPQPLYPFEFIRADAIADLPDLVRSVQPEAIHASPPCQAVSSLRFMRKGNRDLVNLIPDVQRGLRDTRLPYVIENVNDTTSGLHNPVMLCGTMFGLRVYRHRFFETSGFTVTPPPHGRHVHKCARNGVMPDHERLFMTVTGRNGFNSAEWVREAALTMGVPWLMRDNDAVCESIPPAYTACIGSFLHEAVRRA